MLLQLTKTLTNTASEPVLIHPDHIVYVEPSGGGQGSNVYLVTREMLKVQEHWDQIHAMTGGEAIVTPPEQPTVGPKEFKSAGENADGEQADEPDSAAGDESPKGKGGKAK